MDVKRAVTEAVNECIEEGVLADFFRENKKKVIDMSIYEYNAEEHDQVLRDESYMEGHEAGLARGKVESIIQLLSLKWEIPDELKDRIQILSDLEQLDEWLNYAVQAKTYEEFLDLIDSSS